MTRALVIFVALVAVAAVIASDRAKPLLAEPHSSGRWNFHNAAAPMDGHNEATLNGDGRQSYELCPWRPSIRNKGVHQV